MALSVHTKTRCDALCRTKFPINCDTHLVESFFSNRL
ncbi:DUF6783 domain-containing protein [Fusicatenibacter saccharivorans]